MSNDISPEMEKVKAMRREATRAKWRGRFAKWSWNFVLAEAFLLALCPPAATAALLIATVLTVLHFRADDAFKFRQLPFDVPVALFVLLSGLSICVSPDKGFSFYNWYNLVGVYVLTYFVVGQNLRSVQRVKELLLVIGMAAVCVLLYGFYQFIFGIDISAMKWVDGDAFPELRKRVFSTWENPNILAGYLDIIICLAFGLFLKAGTKQKRIVLGILMAAGAACLAMTYARGACLVIAVIFVAYGMFKDWRVLAACVGVAALLLVADPVLYERLTSVFTKVDTSSEMRLAFWESTVAMIQDHPFLGIGWGAYWMVYPEYDFYLQGADVLIVHAHNMYLNYAAEIGVPGMLAFMWLFFGSLFTALWLKVAPPQPMIPAPTPFDYNEDAAADVELKKVADSIQVETEQIAAPIWQDFIHWPDWRLLAGASAGLGMALISIALNGLTDHLLFNIPSSMFLWLMLAFIASVAALNRKPEPEETNAETAPEDTKESPETEESEETEEPEEAVEPKENEESTETAEAENQEVTKKEEAGKDEKSDNHIEGDH